MPYMVTNIPQMLAYIPYMDPMGTTGRHELVPSGYDEQFAMEKKTCLIGKPSISIRAIYTMAMLNNQMVGD